ncbi:MAG: hypothetical protein WC808_04410 [Patescibacteria group bacterium]|jgi:hypothetical protein
MKRSIVFSFFIICLFWTGLMATDSTTAKLSITCYGQLQFISKDPVFQYQGFNMRRLRPSVIYTQNDKLSFTGEVQIGSGLKLLRAHFDYQAIPGYLYLKGGQFPNRLMFFESSPTRKYFVLVSHLDYYIEDQNPTGIAAYGHYKFFAWELQVTNGTVTGAPDNNEQKEVNFWTEWKISHAILLSTCLQRGRQLIDERTTAWIQLKTEYLGLNSEIGAINQSYSTSTCGFYLNNKFQISQFVAIAGRVALPVDHSEVVMANGYIARNDLEFTPGVIVSKDNFTAKLNTIISRNEPRYAAEIQFIF